MAAICHPRFMLIRPGELLIGCSEQQIPLLGSSYVKVDLPELAKTTTLTFSGGAFGD